MSYYAVAIMIVFQSVRLLYNATTFKLVLLINLLPKAFLVCSVLFGLFGFFYRVSCRLCTVAFVLFEHTSFYMVTCSVRARWVISGHVFVWDM